MELAIVSEQKRRKELQEIAARVVEEMDGQLFAMNSAAWQISSGGTPEDIDDAGYHLYLARKDPKDHGSRAEAVMSTVNYRALKDTACDYDNAVSHLAG
jgi:hypothetical protein